MSNFAHHVVRLVEDLRRMTAPQEDKQREAVAGPPASALEDPRPPKRPWEDMSRDDPNGHLAHSEVRLAGPLRVSHLRSRPPY